MRNTFKIFGRDLKALSRHFFALAVALVITFLPSLYAWLNIYSNWDPYGNTGNISIAAVSLDKGYTDEDGGYINKGTDVIDDLKSSSAINWVILADEQQAVEGVYAGDYYAAVVIDENFSYKMYNMLTEWVGKPSITYYENAKKNAVATKITDTAVESLKRSISENYLEVLISSLMKSANALSAELTEADPEGSVKGLIGQTRDLLSACLQTMDAFSAANDLKEQNGLGIDPEKLAELIRQININIPEGGHMQDTVADINVAVYEALEKFQQALDSLQQTVDKGQITEETEKIIADAAQIMGGLGDRVTEWGNAFPSTDETGLTVKDLAWHLAENCYKLQERLQQLGEGDVNSILSDCSGIVSDVITLTGSLIPTAEDLQQEINKVLLNAANTLDCMRGLAYDAARLRDAAADALISLDNLMGNVRPIMQRMTASLYDKLYKLSTLDGQEYMDTLVKILGGSPVVYGDFFSQLVQTTVNQIYPIENYGSAMAPFYSVLAIWVGGVILAAILKANASPEGISAPKPIELFFGRYLLFFIMSQMQAAIIILGDLYILKIQCLHPGLLFLTGALTSFTFSLLIYALAVSFGDVGKAIVVVVMVIQIAGSSGTFPIELLPDIYQKVYRFFPFPYAINAMRECICGLYGHSFQLEILKLLGFAAAALVIGLLVRRPFIGLTEFMEEKLEKTELF